MTVDDRWEVTYLAACDWSAPWHGPQEIARRLGRLERRCVDRRVAGDAGQAVASKDWEPFQGAGGEIEALQPLLGQGHEPAAAPRHHGADEPRQGPLRRRPAPEPCRCAEREPSFLPRGRPRAGR